MCIGNGMATKAEKYRAEQQRANQATHPKKAPPKTERADHKAGVEGTAARNLKTAASHVKKGPALEDSGSGKPSRKSTRGSTGRIKLATNLQRREIRRVHSPEARAARSAAR
jgi:hypothetical protein